jgi:hypothetical protein
VRIRNLLAGAAVGGALLAGTVAAAPAQATTDSSAGAQSVSRHYHRWYSNSNESHNHEGYWYGYWEKRGSHYYVNGDLYDRHHGDGDYSYVWYRYYDSRGNFHKDYYRTNDHNRISEIRFTRDFDVRVCEGDTRDSGCSWWYDLY